MAQEVKDLNSYTRRELIAMILDEGGSMHRRSSYDKEELIGYLTAIRKGDTSQYR